MRCKTSCGRPQTRAAATCWRPQEESGGDISVLQDHSLYLLVFSPYLLVLACCPLYNMGRNAITSMRSNIILKGNTAQQNHNPLAQHNHFEMGGSRYVEGAWECEFSNFQFRIFKFQIFIFQDVPNTTFQDFKVSNFQIYKLRFETSQCSIIPIYTFLFCTF